MKAPLPENEKERLRALYDYGVLDTGAEEAFDDLTLLASQICETPIALVSLIDEDRQWFKSKVGVDAEQTSRDIAFCAHAILEEETLVVSDASKDERFSQNDLVVGDPNIRFYAGTPLRTPSNLHVGTLCVIDRVPRELTEAQLRSLEALGRQVVSQLELRTQVALLGQKNDLLEELRRINDEVNRDIQERNAELEQFAHIASHDLKAPLRGIANLVDWIGEDLAEAGIVLPDHIAEHRADISSQIARMDRLLTGILDFARAGKVQGDGEHIVVSQFVENTIKLASVPSSFEVVHSTQSLTMIANASALQRVLLNLLTNAIKHHDRDDGKVSIQFERIGDTVRFLVTDDGPGIPSEHHERIFGMFERLQSSRVSEGSGIGLSTVRRLAKTYGGEVSIHSDGGRGTTFEVLWPATPPKA